MPRPNYVKSVRAINMETQFKMKSKLTLQKDALDLLSGICGDLNAMLVDECKRYSDAGEVTVENLEKAVSKLFKDKRFKRDAKLHGQNAITSSVQTEDDLNSRHNQQNILVKNLKKGLSVLMSNMKESSTVPGAADLTLGRTAITRTAEIICKVADKVATLAVLSSIGKNTLGRDSLESATEKIFTGHMANEMSKTSSFIPSTSGHFSGETASASLRLPRLPRIAGNLNENQFTPYVRKLSIGMADAGNYSFELQATRRVAVLITELSLKIASKAIETSILKNGRELSVEVMKESAQHILPNGLKVLPTLDVPTMRELLKFKPRAVASTPKPIAVVKTAKKGKTKVAAKNSHSAPLVSAPRPKKRLRASAGGRNSAGLLSNANESVQNCNSDTAEAASPVTEKLSMSETVRKSTLKFLDTLATKIIAELVTGVREINSEELNVLDIKRGIKKLLPASMWSKAFEAGNYSILEDVTHSEKNNRG